MRDQPHPDVTFNDVERIIRRDFPIEQFDTVMAVLKQYGTEKWHRECARVQLAVLKLSNGDLHKRHIAIDVAMKDYRDVIVPAEYPEYSRGLHTRELPVKVQEGIIRGDWEQYESWLRK